MNSKHQLDEMHLSRQLKSHKNFQHLFYTSNDDYDSDIIECPFCFSVTAYFFNSPNRCTSCYAEITDADILNSYID